MVARYARLVRYSDAVMDRPTATGVGWSCTKKTGPRDCNRNGPKGRSSAMTATKAYPQIDLFRQSLPAKPYCTDELGFLEIRAAEFAIQKRFIQPNTPSNLRWMVYDVDRPEANFDWIDRHCPPPNLIATNRENGHAHLFYGLEVPVWQQYGKRDLAYRFAAAVDVALTTQLDADRGYAKLISKNPLREDAWIVQSFQPYSYDLPWLADYLDLDPYEDLRRNLPAIGLGRNCTLFDRLRMWAYRNIRREWLGPDFWRYAVEVAGTGYNDFPLPLPSSEVRATSKSVAKWTWSHMSPEGFRAWSEGRRRKSLAVRKGRAEATAEKVREYKATHPEASNRAIGAVLGVSEFTVRQALR